MSVLRYHIFWNKNRNLFSPIPIVRENLEKGGVLHGLRRSIPLHQKSKWIQVGSLFWWSRHVVLYILYVCLVLMEIIEILIDITFGRPKGMNQKIEESNKNRAWMVETKWTNKSHISCLWNKQRDESRP